MIYLDTSVALAHLLAEDRAIPEDVWSETLISSRLLEYELWCRIHARKLAVTHGELVQELLSRVSMIELNPPVLKRVKDPFPAPVRTLDAIHLASADFLREQNQTIEIATLDDQMAKAAKKMGFELRL